MPCWGVLFILATVARTAAQSPGKFEPPTGQVYHGAFPVSQWSTNPGDYWLDIPWFENHSGKELAIVLWYADWSSSFSNSVGYLIDQYLKPRGAVIEVGWMPSGVSLDAINAGTWDAYLRQWFADARDKGEPILLRFACEMNGTWTNWDGWNNGGSTSTALGWQATEKYKAMWRRVYSIARQMHACNVAFVWAPNYVSCPDGGTEQYAWNHWRNYYPGDEYVDWVGVDLYDFEGQDPQASIQPFYDEYAARKPIVLAETAGHDDTAVGADKVRYIQQLFDAMQNVFPRLKAFVWFNYQIPSYNFRIDETPASLAAYQSRVAGSRYVGAISRTMADAIRQPLAQDVIAGGTATFEIGIVDGGTLGYQWQKSGLNISDDGHFSGATTGTLTISRCIHSDVGSYRCVVTGGCANVTSASAALAVKQLGDFDLDGDVDQEDFGHLQACLTTLAMPQADPACADAKLNDDDYINQFDVARFIRCMSGPGVAVDPECAN